MRVLILGGYGVFGGRLAELLADESSLELIVAGRNGSRAREFCAQHESAATMTPAVADRRDIEPVLAAVKPDLLIDASGPFQAYGASRYDVVRGCIRHAVNYLDLADAPDFVGGIGQFDTDARDAGVFVLSGISSFPALTAAVVRELGKRLTVRTLSVGIAPSPYAGVGMNVMRAVLAYSGSRVELTRNGGKAYGIGLVESRRYTIAPPGRLPLDNRRFSLVDVPDLTLLPGEFPEIADIWIGAGPVPEILHRLLNLLAVLRWKLRLPSLTPLAGLCHRAINTFRSGEPRGGMLVEAKDGRGKTLAWHLLAEGDDGAYIPSMAAESIVRRALGGDPPRPGARTGAGALTLADYEDVFAGRSIHTGMREAGGDAKSLFHDVLGERFNALPASVRELHDCKSTTVWRGRVVVTGARSWAARLIGWTFGFPARDEETDVRVEVVPTGRGEVWTRTFGAKQFRSELSRGEGREAWLLCERFGAVSIAIALVLRDGKLWYVPRRWRLGRIPLPRALMPAGRSFEADRDGAFAFDVTIEAPIVGHIAGYRGTLRRDRGES